MTREKSNKINKPRREKGGKPSVCPALHQVVAECADEQQQQKLYAELIAKGYRCRLLNL